MNKKILNEYQQLIKADEFSLDANNNLKRVLVRRPLINLFLLGILLIFSFINYDKVSKLAQITFESFINEQDILGPKIYFGLLITTVVCLIIFIVVMYVIKERSGEYIDHLKGLYRTYVTFDLISFIVNSVIFLYFTIMFILTPCTIDGRSMEGSLHDGDRVIVWHFAVNPNKDDIIIFDVSNEAYGVNEGFFVKRIVAEEGDTLTYLPSSGELYVNNYFLENITIGEYNNIYYSAFSSETTTNHTFVIPDGRYLAFGDNRDNSTDSRVIGLIYEKDILGKVTFRFFPFSKFGQIKKNVIHTD